MFLSIMTNKSDKKKHSQFAHLGNLGKYLHHQNHQNHFCYHQNHHFQFCQMERLAIKNSDVETPELIKNTNPKNKSNQR